MVNLLTRIQMPNTSLELDRVIRETLLPVMDRDTFAIVDKRPASATFFNETVVVADTTGDQISAFGAAHTLNVSSSPAVAIVDRSADIANAVEHIVRARFSFCGTSPYAPDLVFVNEFVVDDFCRAALKIFTSSLSDAIQTSHKTRSWVKHATSTDSEATVLVSGARGRIQLLKRRFVMPLTLHRNEF